MASTVWMETGWCKPCVKYIHKAFAEGQAGLRTKVDGDVAGCIMPPSLFQESLPIPCTVPPSWIWTAKRTDCGEKNRGDAQPLCIPVIMSHGLFGSGDKPETSTRAFCFCSCALLFCKGLKSKYLWEPLLFSFVFWKGKKKKEKRRMMTTLLCFFRSCTFYPPAQFVNNRL